MYCAYRAAARRSSPTTTGGVVFRSIAFPVPSMPFWSACLRIIATIVAHWPRLSASSRKDDDDDGEQRCKGQEKEEVVEDGYTEVR